MLQYNTKIKHFSGHPKNVSVMINEFFHEFEKNGNNINILHLTQSDGVSGYVNIFITYKEDIQPINEKQTSIDWSGFPDSTRIQKQEFTIRKEVLNIPQYGWERINGSVCKFEEESFKITVIDFWKMLGTHGGFLSAKLNKEERDFCDLYYNHIRKDNDANAIFNK